MKIDNHVVFAGSGHQTRFERAAEQFESLLINELLAPLAKQEDDTQDGAGSQVKQTALQALSTAMSKSGGIGIARMMERKLLSK